MILKQLGRSLLCSFFVLSGYLTALAEDEVALVGAEAGKWTMDYDAAVKLAKEKNLPMMLNFTGSDWCGWCKLMDKNVFTGQSWKDYAKDHVVLVTIDFPRDPLMVPEAYLTRNNKLKDKFAVQGYPTYVVLDSDGETVLSKLTAGQEKTPDSFVEEFKRATKLSSSNTETYIKANPDKADAFKAAIADYKSLQGELKAWIETRPKETEANTKIFKEFISKIQAATTKLEEFE